MDVKELKSFKQECETKISGELVSLIGELENKTGIRVIGVYHSIDSIYDCEGKTSGMKVRTNICLDV